MSYIGREDLLLGKCLCIYCVRV